jgi:hypothetical protein
MDARLRRIALRIVAKAPAAGQVKTRLCPPLSLDEAARLYQCFLEDKIAQVLGIHGVEPVLAYAPDDAAAIFEALASGVSIARSSTGCPGARRRSSRRPSGGHGGLASGSRGSRRGTTWTPGRIWPGSCPSSGTMSGGHRFTRDAFSCPWGEPLSQAGVSKWP